jgi:uncharacterized Zn finger protein
MEVIKETDISYYNYLFNLKLTFECKKCGAVANAYPPKDDNQKVSHGG